MRSIVSILALATSLAAPMGAVAATPNTFTTPTNTRHQSKEQVVFLNLVNYTSHATTVVIGGQAFKVDYDSVRRVVVPVGSLVTEYSETNSKANGLQLMTVSASDEDKSVFLK